MSIDPFPASRESVERRFKASDGASIFYRAWLPAGPARAALLLFHRGHEHSARWQETVDELELDDVAVFAWDARGHGQSPGERGSAENLARVVQDVDEFVGHVSQQYGFARQDMIVLGHSVGGVLAAAWVHDYAPPIRALILAAPAFRVKLYVPLAIPLLRLRQKLFGPGYVKSYVKAKMLTHDPEQARLYRQDSAIFPQIAVKILLDLYDASTRLLADAGAIHAPTLLLAAGNDWVVRQSAQRTFFERLSSQCKRFEVLPGMHHAVFHELDRRLVVEKVRSFVREWIDRPPEPWSLVEADRYGFTRNEYDRLLAPGPLKFKLVRFGMKTLGRLSAGIRLGWEAGFDSGRTLDYVYQNEPAGTTPLGRWFDRRYLNSIGWAGIRQRGANLQRLLEDAIGELHAAGRPVRLLDIASGPGRYLLETLKRMADVPCSALLRDYKEENVVAARRLARRLGLYVSRREMMPFHDSGCLV
ncbi:MAG TPA: bifunctional alpha/beta hydrolase/class I SAM-dependent methyltransferase [Pirellulales bacterium]|nr:bifunctional alpha/beta hydrolase/class I SAM-dependent methyltransferase [Pirellulales bacterium]